MELLGFSQAKPRGSRWSKDFALMSRFRLSWVDGSEGKPMISLDDRQRYGCREDMAELEMLRRLIDAQAVSRSWSRRTIKKLLRCTRRKS